MTKTFVKKSIILFSIAAMFLSVGTVFADTTLTTVSVSPSSVSITVGSTTQLTALPFDENGATYASTTTATWLSDTNSVATVDSSGLVTGVSAGTSTIGVSLTDGTSTVSSTADITVTATTPVLTALTITPASSSLSVGSTTQLYVSLFDQNGAAYAATTTVTWLSGNTAAATIDTSGLITGISAGTSTVTATAVSGAVTVTNTADIVVTAAATTTVRTVSLTVRNAGSVIWTGQASVTDSDTATTTITATDGATSTIYSASALMALISADTAQPEFSISDLQYYSSFGSFYLKCITASTTLCDNWQYAVNDSAPGVGADQYKLTNGQNLVFYYGYTRRVSLSSSAVTIGSPVTATAETYKPSTDTYIPAPGVTIGATQPDPANPWSPLEIATSTSDSNGQAVFTLNATGTYQFGIQEDYYSPTTDFSVGAPVVLANSGGGITHHAIDTGKAAQFLLSKESSDGSFGPLLYTDWAAIALVANSANSGSPTNKVAAYLKSKNDDMSVTTDYERHAMALMSLGINPYNGTSVNYIQKIVDKFDGTQVGDSGLVNDDIFSLFPLIKAGYTFGDPMIQKIVSFILSKQNSDGSWDGSVDMTAAGIQALSQATAINGVNQAIVSARAYLVVRQNSDGGFGSSYSTSWAMQGISAIHESVSSWTKNNNTPDDYLYSLQQVDGGIENVSMDSNSRIWATSYAIPAALNKSWYDILSTFSKPVAGEITTGGGSTALISALQNEVSTTTASTTIPLVEATSSKEIANTVSSTIIMEETKAVVAKKTLPIANKTISAAGQKPKLAQSKPLIVPATVAPELPANNLGGKSKEQAGNNRPNPSGLASVVVAASHLLSFVGNMGGLLVSKFFSIINLIK